ncbi:MAG: exo-alpha-sialidase [Acidobacteria bacterium]|nr:exo-alpha-sialidase [Acidobacteriota bacterium]
MPKRLLRFFLLFLALLLAPRLPVGDRLLPVAGAQAIGVGAQRAPCIIVDGKDNLYLMMSTATKTAAERTPGSQIFFTQSADHGATWDNFPVTRNLSNSNGEAFGGVLAVTKANKPKFFAVYHDTAPGPTQAFLLRTKKGTKFRAPKNITPHNGGAFTPRLALDSGDNVHVVWGDTLTGKRVAYLRSTDMGASFSDLVDLSRSTGNAFEPEIAVAPDDSIHVVWEDDASGSKAIMYTRSTDGGANFSTPTQLSQGAGAAVESYIAIDTTGRIYVSWSQEMEGAVQAFFTRSTNNGGSFSTPVNLSQAANGDVRKTVITTFQDRVYVAYNNDNDRDHQAYVLQSTDAGVSFGEPVQVSDANRNRGRAHSVTMVVDSRGTLHVVWVDNSVLGNEEGFLQYSQSSNGRNFSRPVQILAYVSK